MTRTTVKRKDQVVVPKSPWPKVLSALAVTIAVIVLFWYLEPNFANGNVFFKQLKEFFVFKPGHIGLQTITIGDTVLKTFKLLWDTILFSLLGTILGIIISIPIALVSSKAIVKKWYIYTPFRVIMSIIRAIPPLVVAYVFFNIFSPSLSAALALAIFVSTMMTKWIYEELDSVDLSVYQAMLSFGNSKFRATRKGILPIISGKIISLSIYTFEIVIRFATILGVVGISTIGLLLNDNYKPSYLWGHMSIVLYILIGFIFILEIFSRFVMKRVFNYSEKAIDKKKMAAITSLDKKINYVKNQKSKIWIAKAALGVAIFAILCYSIAITSWSMAPQGRLDQIRQYGGGLVHPDWSLFTESHKDLNVIYMGFKGLLVAVAAVVMGTIFGTFFGILASKNVVGKYWALPTKLILITIRSMPAFFYAILFIFLVDNAHVDFLAALALGIHSIGMLGKLTYEKIESLDDGAKIALEVVGANKVQTIKWAIIAEAIPTILSNALYRIEINFKSLVQVGAVGASAFGMQMAIFSADPRHYSQLSAYIIVTIVIVLIVEQISNLGRKKLMTGRFFSADNKIAKRIKWAKRKSAFIYSKAFGFKFSDNEEMVKYICIEGAKKAKQDPEKLSKAKSSVEIALAKNDIKSEALYQERLTLLNNGLKSTLKLKEEALKDNDLMELKLLKSREKDIRKEQKAFLKKHDFWIKKHSYRILYN